MWIDIVKRKHEELHGIYNFPITTKRKQYTVHVTRARKYILHALGGKTCFLTNHLASCENAW